MNAITQGPERLVETVVAAFTSDPRALPRVLEELKAPIYVTDAEGLITYFNAACIDFSGRTPTPGRDQWCVTWKLYMEDGTHLPHEKCPMAVAIREKRPLRGAVAVAERPDGTRVMFTPFPTPIVDEAGEVLGAVNLLLDITDLREIERLETQARRCHRLATSSTDEQTIETLNAMASEYEELAEGLRTRATEVAIAETNARSPGAFDPGLPDRRHSGCSGSPDRA
jgi:PAS domain S-box-containing protein